MGYFKNKKWGVTSLDGQLIPLRQVMYNAGFKEEELAKLKQAEDLSNDLVIKEDVAMHAVKGLFKDENGAYTIESTPNETMARRLVFGRSYRLIRRLL